MTVIKTGAVRFLLVLLCALATGAQADKQKPLISIIIDDLGHNRSQAEYALQLPHDVTLSILPHAPYSQEMSQRAAKQGREYMLHLPMEGRSLSSLELGALTVAMDENAFLASLKTSLGAFSGYAGVNNHQGSVLTANTDKMHLLLQTLAQQKSIFLVDSKTTAASQLPKLASHYPLPFASRNVFLDVDRSTAAIEKQLDELLSIAERIGSAIAIGHPYPTTLAVLDRFLINHQQAQYQLVPVSQLIAWRHLSVAKTQTLQKSLAVLE